MLSTLRIMFSALLTVTFVVVLYLFVFLLSPIYIFRFILSRVGKYIIKDLGSILTPASTVVHHLNIVLVFDVEGNLQVEQMREFFESKIISFKLPNGKLKYPELQQYIFQYCGFLFWKWDRKFDIRHHIRKLPAKSDKYANLNELRQFLQDTPMEDDKSPWEFLLLENCKPDGNSKVIFRLAHSLADGYSISKLLFEAMPDGSPYPMPKSSVVTAVAKDSEIWKWIRVIIYLTKKIFELFHHPTKYFDIHDWHKFGSGYHEKFQNYMLEPIPMKKAKEIQKLHGVCLPSVIIALVTGGIRKMMLKSKVTVPKEIRMCYPYPLANHPDQLRNHFVIAEISIPIGECDAVTRLRIIRKNVEELKIGPVPLFMQTSMLICGSLFYWMAGWVTKSRWITMFLSNFPTPTKLVLFGKNVADMNFVNGIPHGNIGIVVSCVGYLDNLNIIVQMQQSVLSEQNRLSQIVEFVKEEFEELSQNL